MPIRKILITNIVSLNIGDAAILWGSIEILKRKYGPDTEVIVFDKAADVAQKYYPWVNYRQALFARPALSWLGRVLERKGYGHWNNRFKFLRFFMTVLLLKHRIPFLARFLTLQEELKDIREYTTADLILSSGGTYLTENYGLSPAIMDYYLSLATEKPFGFFTQTLGPFNSPRNRKAFKSIFSRAKVILLRDDRSKNHVLELGVDSNNIHLAADAAFVFAADSKQPQGSIPKYSESPRVAISVRSMSFFQDKETKDDHISYFKGMALAVKVAVEEFGAKVTFLSTCQGIPEYWTNDANTADEIYTMLPDDVRENVEVDRQFRQPWEVVEIYQTYDVVIATRMHAAILSLCARTPTLGIAYEFKMEELFSNLKMPELVLNIDSLSIMAIKKSVRRLLSERDRYRPLVNSAAENMCKRAWLAVDALPQISADTTGR